MSILVATTNGNTAEFPDGTDPSVIQAAMAKQFSSPQADASSSPAEPTFMGNLPAAIGQGMTDATLGAGQFVANAPPFNLVPGLADQFNASAKEKAKLDAPLLAAPGGTTGSAIGNAAALAPAGSIGGIGTGVLKALTTGALQGGLAGITLPVSADDYAAEKAKQVATGATVGGLVGGGLSAAAKGAQALLPQNLVGTVMNAIAGKAKGSDFAAEGEQLADRTGIDLTPAQITGSKPQTMLENLARQSIFSRAQAAQADAQIAQQWSDYVGRTIDGVSSSPGNSAEIGQRVQGAVKNAVKDMTATRNAAADADYGQIRAMTQGKVGVTPQNYIATLQDLSQQFSGGPKGSDYDKLSTTIGSLLDSARSRPILAADMDTMMKNRRFLSQVAGGQIQLAGDTGRNMQKSIAVQLLNAIDQDLDASAQKIGGPVGEMLQQSNARYRLASQQIEGLQNSAMGKLVGDDFANAMGNGTFNQIPGEVVMQRISAMKPSQIESMKGLLQQNDPETWQEVKRSVLENALTLAQSTPASEGANAVAARPGVFVSALAKTPEDQARLASIFSPQEKAQIDDAIASAKRISDKTGTNFSGTAAAAEGYGVMESLGSALYGNLAPAVGLGAQAMSMRSVANIMANSQGRAVIQQMARLPAGSPRLRELSAQLSAIAAAQDVNPPTQGSQ